MDFPVCLSMSKQQTQSTAQAQRSECVFNLAHIEAASIKLCTIPYQSKYSAVCCLLVLTNQSIRHNFVIISRNDSPLPFICATDFMKAYNFLVSHSALRLRPCNAQIAQQSDQTNKLYFMLLNSVKWKNRMSFIKNALRITTKCVVTKTILSNYIDAYCVCNHSQIR